MNDSNVTDLQYSFAKPFMRMFQKYEFYSKRIQTNKQIDRNMKIWVSWYC